MWQVRAKHAQINLHIYGPQIGAAAISVCYDPRSLVAKDNLEAFCQMWQYLVDDVIQISKEVADQTRPGLIPPPPRIMKQPPTPSSGTPPPYSPLVDPHSYGFQDGYGHHPPPDGHNGNSMGKFHKSVPDLNAVLHGMQPPQGQPLPNQMRGGGGPPPPQPLPNSYLDPNPPNYLNGGVGGGPMGGLP